MENWIATKERMPTKEHYWCWVMNSRRGAYGFLATWDNWEQIFRASLDVCRDTPALDVTHWYPLPMPFYGEVQ